MIIGIPPYLLLLVAILLLYLLDCIIVLYANEAIVKPQASGWRVEFGSAQPWVAGKRIHLLNPFTPTVATYRAHWQVSEHLAHAEEEALVRCARHVALLSRLDAPIRATAWTVLIILPIAMMLWGALGFLLGAGICWAVVIALLVRFFFLRGELELGWGGFSLLAFECLACPPCAVNLLRKLSLRQHMGIDLVGFLAHMPDDRAALAFERIGERTDALLLMMDDDTPEFARTREWRELIRPGHSRPAHEEKPA